MSWSPDVEIVVAHGHGWVIEQGRLFDADDPDEVVDLVGMTVPPLAGEPAVPSAPSP